MKAQISHNLPAEDAIFVNRSEEVKEIVGLLSHPRVWMITLRGIAGVGKSALALHVAYQCLRENIFDAIVWSTAKSYELGIRGLRQTREKKRDRVLLSLNDLLDTIGRAFGARSILRLDVRQKREQIVQFLKATRTLMIVDNLDMVPDRPAAEIVQFVRDFLPSPSKAIITSRYELAGKAEYALLLTGLNLDDSIQLLRQEAKRANVRTLLEADRKILEQIYQGTWGIPLAMKWMVGHMRGRKKSIDDVLDELTRAGSHVLEFCFRQSYWDLSREARKLLQIISLPDTSLDRRQMLLISGLREYQLTEALDDLVPRSLLEYDENRQLYVLHPLTRAFARAELAKNKSLEREGLDRYERYFE